MLNDVAGRRLTRTMALVLSAWLTAALLAVAGIGWAVERLAKAHLEADAERSALGWARHVADHVPHIDAVFAGELPAEQTRERLGHMLGTAGLFRFKLFSPDGRLLIVSDDLSRHAPSHASQAADSERARTAARAGHRHVALKHGDGTVRPPYFSEAYVPVMRGGRALGVVEVYIDQTQLAAMTSGSFRRAALTASGGLLLSFAISALLWRWHAARNGRTQARVHYLANHDVLTGAITRASFTESLSTICNDLTAGTAQHGLGLLCVDLDRFTDVNDTHGHVIGDTVLRMVAARLQAVLAGGDRLARLAGDRFAVQAALEPGMPADPMLQALAQRICHGLAEPFTLPAGGAGAGLTIHITASLGAVLHGRHGADADTLLQKAELALLQAKAQGCGRWTFYDATLDRAIQDRRQLTADLAIALERGALQLHYQPVYSSHTEQGSRLLGYEALARWSHPTRGMVPPLTFVALAEASGQIEALGRWVLDTACAEAATWPAQLGVAINLSPAQFRNGGHELVSEVQHALQASGLPPSRLELEITESLLMNHTDEVLATLKALHALGVRIAMDDFGTGYSSLAYLWRFPFDKLKIDRAFTQGLGSDGKVEVIVRSIVTLAHSLAIRVNAEGVETAAQQGALRRLGCDELQGFLLGRPMAPDRLVHRSDRQLVVHEPALS